MKKIISVLLVLNGVLNSGLASASDVEINKVTCHDLALKSSVVAFSPDHRDVLYVPYKLTSKRGGEYINMVRNQLLEKLDAFCSSGKSEISFDQFKVLYHATCSSLCQDHSNLFRGKKHQDNADMVCINICNESYDNLTIFEQGFVAGKTQQD